jgi:4,5-dihydroxyphthalate decarboxylase
MTAATGLELAFEAQAAQPNFRYDIIQPLLQGRATIEGVTLAVAGATSSAGYFDNPKFKNGDFALLDNNWGDVIPAIDAGWDVVALPLFVKRKPVYNYLWVRADRGINSPKDLEGKTLATGGYQSAITIYTRGFLQHFYGVNLTRLRWLSVGPKRWEVHDQVVQVEYAPGGKNAIQRLLDGDVDASTGDILDPKAWAALESSPDVKRLFPDYEDLNLRLFKEQGIFTPVHIVVMGGKLARQDPGLARRVYDGFARSAEMAYADALGDGSGFSMTVGNREAVRDQLEEWGDIWTHGIKANRNTIDTFLDYNFEQGLTKTRLSNEQVFARETLDT